MEFYLIAHTLHGVPPTSRPSTAEQRHGSVLRAQAGVRATRSTSAHELLPKPWRHLYWGRQQR